MGKINNKKPRHKKSKLKLNTTATADELKPELSVPGTNTLVTTDKSGPVKSDLSVSDTVTADSTPVLASETKKKKKKKKQKKDVDNKSSDAVQNEAEDSGVESESDFLSKSKVIFLYFALSCYSWAVWWPQNRQ